MEIKRMRGRPPTPEEKFMPLSKEERLKHIPRLMEKLKEELKRNPKLARGFMSGDFEYKITYVNRPELPDEELLWFSRRQDFVTDPISPILRESVLLTVSSDSGVPKEADIDHRISCFLIREPPSPPNSSSALDMGEGMLSDYQTGTF